jgi:uncharacterized membrane protein (UPF0182 family)
MRPRPVRVTLDQNLERGILALLGPGEDFTYALARVIAVGLGDVDSEDSAPPPPPEMRRASVESRERELRERLAEARARNLELEGRVREYRRDLDRIEGAIEVILRAISQTEQRGDP